MLQECAGVEMLGLTVDKLSFKKHITILCQTSSYKLHALRRIRKYLTLEKARAMESPFMDSQFNYTPHGNLLTSDNSASLHQKHISTSGFWLLRFSKVCLRQIRSLCGTILVVKTYHMF